MIAGEYAHHNLHGILENFREEFNLANTNRTACRCGDSSSDLLRKILFVVRSGAGLLDTAQTEWRPGDGEWHTSLKILHALGTTAEAECRCGDSLFDIWRKILNAVRNSRGLPDIADFAFRFGDSLNVLLRKLLLLLGSEVIIVPSCECSDMNDWGELMGPIVCCEDWGGFSGPIIECEVWGNV